MERIDIILEELDRLFPDAHCELNYSTPLELAIAVMLSAQTTDKSVNKLTKSLFNKYTCVEDYANASLEELQDDLHTIGLYRNKARNIKNMCIRLIDDFDGQLPSDRTSLESLPGIGRKSANVILSEVYHVPALAVDTHVERISKRLGLADEDDSVLMVEKKLTSLIPKERWIKTHHQLIFFGRYHCKAQKPLCKECHLYDLCLEEKRKNIA